MNYFKKIFSITLILVMVVSLFGAAASADEKKSVYLTVENLTYYGENAPWTGKLIDCAEVEIVEGETKLVDVIVDGIEAAGYTQSGADLGYITDVNGLGEFGASAGGGWMVALNDWFTSAGITEFYVSDGDMISLMYTSVGFGEDIGSSWGNNNKNLKEISFSEGELSEEFSPDTYEYTLTVPAEVESIKITPTAENKNFQTRIYLNTEFSEGDNGKFIEGEIDFEGAICGLDVWQPLPENIGFYKRTQEIPVCDGDVISVACGLNYWSSMNNGEFGFGGEYEPGTVYVFNVEKEQEQEEEQISVSAGIYDYTAVTYKENNPDCAASVSSNGIILETQDFSVSAGTSVLDALTEILEASQIDYELDANSSYLTRIGELSEMACTSQSGWMISVNDRFPSESASDVTLSDGDVIKLHYSVNGWGEDIGNFFVGGPSLTNLSLGGTQTVITSNTEYADENDWTGTTTYYLGEYEENGKNTPLEGDGSIQSPFIIPVAVSADTDITSLEAEIKTTLHENYLCICEEDGLSNILSEISYEDDVTFAVETIGGFYRTFYTIKVTKDTDSDHEDNNEENFEEDFEDEVEDETDPSDNSSLQDSTNSGKTTTTEEEKAEEEKKEEALPLKFTDINGHWAESYISRLFNAGIINGKSENSFAPEDSITRAEIVSLLYRMSGENHTPAKKSFNDINENDWFFEAIDWAYENGIASGMTSTEFNPQELVNREQAAVFVVRFCDLMKYRFKGGETTAFTDSEKLSDWSRDYVLKAQAFAIINGFEDGSFMPEGKLTRAQTAKMLCYIVDNKAVEE